MAAIPPPEGMTEEDYEAIQAAVVETVRGRWFLAEYARRSRVDEVQEMLAAIGRLESLVTAQRALPSADASPHSRLLAQRADEIAANLAGLVEDLRDSGADPYLCDDLEAQVRAIGGLVKGGAPTAETAPATPINMLAQEPRRVLEAPAEPLPPAEDEATRRDLPTEEPEPLPPLPAALAPAPPASAPPLQMLMPAEDPRLAALAPLDRLSLTEKLALFS